MTNPHQPAGYPTLSVYMMADGAQRVIDFVKQTFDAEELRRYDNPDGTIMHAELRLGQAVVMLGSAKDEVQGMRSPREAGGVTGGLYVWMPEVDEHYGRARAAGAEIVLELREMEYGSREYTCRDPEGYLWSFGTYRA